MFDEVMSDDQIEQCCQTYGAKQIADAAERRLIGDRSALLSFGISGASLYDAHHISLVAQRMLSPRACEEDPADASAALETLTYLNALRARGLYGH